MIAEIFIFLLLSFVSGPLNEEFGWRGYSLDRLFIRFGFLKSNLLLGTIWTIWHLFWYFNPNQSLYHWIRYSVIDALLYLPQVILITFVVSYIYVQNNRSIFAGWSVHLMFNFITSQLLMTAPDKTTEIIKIVSIVFSLILAIYSSCSSKFQLKFNTCVDSFKKDIMLANIE